MNYLARDEEYFSRRFQIFLQSILPYHAKWVGRFPHRLGDARIAARESPQEWFKRIVDDNFAGSPEDCAIESNMAVLACVKYSGNLIHFANIQVLIAETDINTLYHNNDVPCQYLRLDYDLDCLGKAFSEPLGHVHTLPKGAPRFSQCNESDNIVLDFFDFVYRSYFYDVWRDWAYYAYVTGLSRANLDEDRFEQIEAAYAAGKPDVLMLCHQEHLHSLKTACRQIKDSVFPGRISSELSSTLSY